MGENEKITGIPVNDEELGNVSGGAFRGYADDGSLLKWNSEFCQYFTCKACGTECDPAVTATHKCSGGTFKSNCCLFCRYGRQTSDRIYNCYHPANMKT